MSSPIDPVMREDVKLGLFLARAVDRFDIWVQKVVERPDRNGGVLQNDEIPPLDVRKLIQ